MERSMRPGRFSLNFANCSRLTRANRRAEARKFYPAEWLSLFDKLDAALNDSKNAELSQSARAQAYFGAAEITRHSGLELVGTEVEPDWAVHGGNFEAGVAVADRARPQRSNFLGASLEEIQRA